MLCLFFVIRFFGEVMTLGLIFNFFFWWVLYANGKLTNNQPSVIGTSKGLACADFAYRGLSAFLFHIQIIREKNMKGHKIIIRRGWDYTFQLHNISE